MPAPQLLRTPAKTLTIRDNGRSADFVAPNFIYGCLGGCRDTYCYVSRYNHGEVRVYEDVDRILAAVDRHAMRQPWPKAPTQCDPVYHTYDIGCSTDVALHYKHTDWERVFAFFRDHPRAKATFATKYVQPALLTWDVGRERKVRIRFSLMPEPMRAIVEPNTHDIQRRLAAIAPFLAAGYEVHVNFSPIVYYDEWLDDYRELFRDLDAAVPAAERPGVKCEAILLTHNPWQHERNVANGHGERERFLWQPDLQEAKEGNYGSAAVRYRRDLKRFLAAEWRGVLQEEIPWCEVRYLF